MPGTPALPGKARPGRLEGTHTHGDADDGESEEERAAAGFRVDMPVGRVARYPKGDGTPVEPRAPRVA